MNSWLGSVGDDWVAGTGWYGARVNLDFDYGFMTLMGVSDPADTPNALLYADFKWQFRMSNREYCYPLTISDVAPVTAAPTRAPAHAHRCLHKP